DAAVAEPAPEERLGHIRVAAGEIEDARAGREPRPEIECDLGPPRRVARRVGVVVRRVAAGEAIELLDRAHSARNRSGWRRTKRRNGVRLTIVPRTVGKRRRDGWGRPSGKTSRGPATPQRGRLAMKSRSTSTAPGSGRVSGLTASMASAELRASPRFRFAA